MLAHAVLILSMAATAAQAQAPVGAEVRGTVSRIEGSARIPLQAALIEVSNSSGITHGAQADSTGAYSVSGLTGGRWTIRAIHAGYEDFTTVVQVPNSGSVLINLNLRSAPIGMGTIFVHGESTQGSAAADSLSQLRVSGVGELGVRSLEDGGGLADLLPADGLLGSVPQDPADDDDVLLLRGSSSDLKLVLLDGAPVYSPFHVGGLLDPFNPGILGGSSVYIGGAPARYDGGLSYIMDVRTRKPDTTKFRSSGSLDLISAHAVVEGGLGDDTSILAGGRALHGFDKEVLNRDDTPVGYRDALVRFNTVIGNGADLSSTFFWNRESVSLGLPSSNTSPVREVGDAEWGNEALSASYHAESNDVSTDVTGAVTRYQAVLPGEDTGSDLARGETRRARISWDVDRPFLGGGRLGYGTVLDRISVAYETRIGDEEVTVPVSAAAVVMGGYAEGSWQVGQVVSIRTGLRFDHFTEVSETRVSPRATLVMLLTESTRLTMATGKYSQYSRALEERAGTGTGSDGPGEPSPLEVPLLPVASATHLVVSLNQGLTGGLSLAVRSFRKSFKGTSGAEGDRFRNSGFEVGLHQTGRRVSGWVDYSVSWFWSQGGDEPRGRSFPNRHLLNAGLSGRWPEMGGLDVGFAFGSGLPFTAIPFGSETTVDVPGGSGPLSQAAPDGGARLTAGQMASMSAPGNELRETVSFFRIDARIYGMLKSSLRGRNFELRPYVKVLNALDDRDALFYLAQFSEDRARPLAELSFLPIVGLEWRF